MAAPFFCLVTRIARSMPACDTAPVILKAPAGASWVRRVSMQEWGGAPLRVSAMAKSKNHTAHNQTRKAHRNGIKKPQRHKYQSLKG